MVLSPDGDAWAEDLSGTDPETGPRVLTFGGDRETFDFADPENYLRVDNDVWTFTSR